MKSLTRNVADVQALLAGATEIWLPCPVTGEKINPPYAVGDQIAVREPWHCAYKEQPGLIIYRADGDESRLYSGASKMPPQFSRITLTVLSVEARKTDTMTEQEARLCGVRCQTMPDLYGNRYHIGDNSADRHQTAVEAFQRDIWQARYGKRYPWATSWAWRYGVSVAVAGRDQ